MDSDDQLDLEAGTLVAILITTPIQDIATTTRLQFETFIKVKRVKVLPFVGLDQAELRFQEEIQLKIQELKLEPSSTSSSNASFVVHPSLLMPLLGLLKLHQIWGK